MFDKGYYKTLHIELPEYMLDETNEEYKNIRTWAKEFTKKINDGEAVGVYAPIHPDIKIYLE